MTAAPPWAFPGSRVLAGWWRQLAPFRPASLWVAHLLLHRVEALARITHFRRPDGLQPLLINLLASRPGITAYGINDLVHLPPQLLHQILRRMEEEGLAESGAAGKWSLTALGQEALRHNEYPYPRYERRAFHFLESSHSGRPPHFLKLNDPATLPCPDEGWRFDVHHLHACIGRSGEWKRRFGFPPDVEEILPPGPCPNPAEGREERGAPPEWQRVILDQPQRLPALLALTPGEGAGDVLVGFAVSQDHWVLQVSEPAFVLKENWRDPFPELGDEPPLGLWHQAWREWARMRGLPASETHVCTLQKHGHRLSVFGTFRLIEQLRAIRSDALKGEAWVLAGAGRFRSAALLEVLGEGADPQPGVASGANAP